MTNSSFPYQSVARLIALYLPQFHTIPENDLWWGTGFTEWVNVKKAKPRFPNHQQPRVPTTLGYYDLQNLAIQATQAKMAREHGIEAFCYYHYWFNGKLLLEKPLELLLANPQVPHAFCLCWANENWTRRWDGQNREVLIAQDDATYDALAHATYLAQTFLDTRYVRVDDKPVFVIYRANLIPTLATRLKQLKAALTTLGVPEILVFAMARGEPIDQELLRAGIDQLIDFQPSEDIPPNGVNLAHLLTVTGKLLSGYVKPNITQWTPKLEFDLVFDYAQVSQQQMNTVLKDKHIPCVFPSWDNSSRRRAGAVIIQNQNANLFAAWLERSIEKVQHRPTSERIVFINAWNEWAEGCYLEPDELNQDVFLQTIKSVLERRKGL